MKYIKNVITVKKGKKCKKSKLGFLMMEVLIVAAIILTYGATAIPHLEESGKIGLESQLKYMNANEDLIARNADDFDPTDTNYKVLPNSKKPTDTIGTDTDNDSVPKPSDEPEIGDITNPVTGFVISPASQKVTLYPGETVQITATIVPPTVTNKQVRWVSFAKDIATVNQAGLITAVTPGTSIVQVQALQNNMSANIEVTVLPVYPTKVSIEPHGTIESPILIYVGESRNIELEFEPINTTEKQGCTFEISKPEFLGLNLTPLSVTGLASSSNKVENMVRVTAVCNGGDGKESINETTVFEVVQKTIDTTSIQVPLTYKEIEVGDTYQVGAVVIPNNATNLELNYESSNTSVATVDENGLVTATATGETYINIRNFGGDIYGSEISKLVRVKVNPKTIPITSFSFSYLSKEFAAGQYLTPVVQYAPLNTSQRDIMWTSSDTTLATVSQGTGQVNALSPGVVTITGTSQYNPSIKHTQTLTVTDLKVTVEGVYFKNSEYRLKPTESVAVSVGINPPDATIQGILYSSEDTTIATIDSAGNLRGVRPGTTLIKAQSKDPQCPSTKVGCSATAKVTVNEVVVSEVILDTKNPDNSKVLNLSKNEVGYVYLRMLPVNSTEKVFLTEYVDDGTLGVSIEKAYTDEIPALTIIGQNFGTRTIKVIAVNGVSDTITVNVNKILANSIEIQSTSPSLPIENEVLKLNKNQQVVLTAKVLPEDTNIKTVSWSTSDSSIATINQNGLVTALKTGSVTIKATSTDPDSVGVSSSITLEIQPDRLSYVESDPIGIFANENQQVQVALTVYNALADDTRLIIKSNDESIIKVKSAERTPNSLGVLNVTFDTLEAGATTIEVTSVDGGISEDNKFVLDVVVTSSEIFATDMTTTDERQVSLANGKTFQTNVSLIPATTTNKTITYESSDSTIATVSSAGLITGIEPGICTVTATSNSNKDLVLTYYVNVLGIPATSISVVPSHVVLYSNELQGPIMQDLAFALTPQNSTYTQFAYEIVSTTSREVEVIDENGVVSIETIYPSTLNLIPGGESVYAIEKGLTIYRVFPYQSKNIYTTLTVEVVDVEAPWDGVTASEELEVVNGSCRVYNGENLAAIGKLSDDGLLKSKCETINIMESIDLGGHTFPYSINLESSLYAYGNKIHNGIFEKSVFSSIKSGVLVRELNLENFVFNLSSSTGLLADTINGRIENLTIKNCIVNSLNETEKISVGVLGNQVIRTQLKEILIENISGGSGNVEIVGIGNSIIHSAINDVGINDVGAGNAPLVAKEVVTSTFTHFYVSNGTGFAAGKIFEFVEGYYWTSIRKSYFYKSDVGIADDNLGRVLLYNIHGNYQLTPSIGVTSDMTSEEFVDLINMVAGDTSKSGVTNKIPYIILPPFDPGGPSDPVPTDPVLPDPVLPDLPDPDPVPTDPAFYYEAGKTPRLLAMVKDEIKYLKMSKPTQLLDCLASEACEKSTLNLGFLAYPLSLYTDEDFESFTTSDESILKINATTGEIESYSYRRDELMHVSVYVNLRNGTRGVIKASVYVGSSHSGGGN